jgi:murein tripeptide amidase MpaA
MVNVDGVVLGNFRTGVLGLDLNRLYREEDCQDFY